MSLKVAPVYAVRAGGQNLIAHTLAEVAELIECAHEADDHVELLVAYYPTDRPLEIVGLNDLHALLTSAR